jgi:hypothetical protein
MAEMTAEMDQIQVPDGGVASFMMSDEDIDNLEREEDQQLAEEVYGGEGISQFTDMAAQMASLGRFGDDVIVHAQTGELVIPKKILDDNPEIKEAVFQQLMAQGIEDPEQYVVGSGSASINPETGLAEYGWGSIKRRIKRTVSSVAKSVKKVASKVVKVAKKVAPIVLPIAMTMMFPALGPIYGAALGSGIGTLIQGGSFKDALKSAAISGLTGAAFRGFTGPGTFSQNVSGALADPGARFAQVGGQLKSGFSGDGFNFGQKFAGAPSGLSPSGEAPADYRGADYQGAPDSAFNQVNNPGLSPEQIQARDLSIANSNNNMSGYNSSGAPEYSMAGQANMQNAGTPQNAANTVKLTPRGGPINSANAVGQGGADTFSGGLNSSQPTQTSFLDKAKQTVFGGPEKTPMDLYNDPNFASDITNKSLRYDMARDVAATTQKNMLQKFAPYALTGGALMYATGGFDTPEDEPVDVLDRDSEGNVITGSTLLAANPDKYLISGLNPAPITYGSPKTPYQSYLDQYKPNNQTFLSASPTIGGPFQRVAQGGEIFPRRTGGILPDEGIPGKDSVRAMLMPGEFVMTTDAVKGMGNGNLQQGIQNMYGVMANLERKGRMA